MRLRVLGQNSQRVRLWIMSERLFWSVIFGSVGKKRSLALFKEYNNNLAMVVIQEIRMIARRWR